MKRIFSSRRLAWTTGLLLSAALCWGCSGGDKGGAKQQPPKKGTAPVQSPAETKPKPSATTTPEPEAKQPKAEPQPEPNLKPKPEPEPPLELEPKPAEKPKPETPPGTSDLPKPTDTEPTAAEGEQPPKPRDLGPPLVDNPNDLRKLDKEKPLWLDPVKKRVVMVGEVCQTEVPLEMFACLKNTKEHEAIVTVDVKAATVHAGLLAVGANAGHPVKFDPKYTPATGSEIEIAVAWKDKAGATLSARAQEWVYDVKTKKAMAYPWVFAGSRFWEDDETKQKVYMAEGGDFICVSNFPSAMLDLPVESTQANAELMFHANKERIPPRGTPVTLILTPKRAPPAKADPPAKPADAEKPQ